MQQVPIDGDFPDVKVEFERIAIIGLDNDICNPSFW